MNRGLSDVEVVGRVRQAMTDTEILETLRTHLAGEVERCAALAARGNRAGYSGRFMVMEADHGSALAQELLEIIDRGRSGEA